MRDAGFAGQVSRKAVHLTLGNGGTGSDVTIGNSQRSQLAFGDVCRRVDVVTGDGAGSNAAAPAARDGSGRDERIQSTAGQVARQAENAFGSRAGIWGSTAGSGIRIGQGGLDGGVKVGYGDTILRFLVSTRNDDGALEGTVGIMFDGKEVIEDSPPLTIITARPWETSYHINYYLSCLV